MTFKIFNALFLIAFLLSAAVQYNDPDALTWMVVYLGAAVMCADRALKANLPWLPPLLLIISLAWATTLLPAIIGQVSLAEVVESITMKTQAVEEAREIGGLLLITIWAGIVLATMGRD